MCVRGAGGSTLVVPAAHGHLIDHCAGVHCRRRIAERECLANRQDDGAGMSLRNPGGIGSRGQVAQDIVHDAGNRYRVGAGQTGVADGEGIRDRVSFRDCGGGRLVNTDRRGDIVHRDRRRIGGAGGRVLIILAADRDGVGHDAGILGGRRVAEGETLTWSQHDRSRVSLCQPGGVGGGGQIAEDIVHHAGDRYRIRAGRASVRDGEGVGDRAAFQDR